MIRYPAKTVVMLRLGHRRQSKRVQPLQSRLEVGNRESPADPAEVTRTPVLSQRARSRERVVEELELNEILAPDQPRDRGGRVLAEVLDVGQPLTPDHVSTGRGKAEHVGVEPDGPRQIARAERQLRNLWRRPCLLPRHQTVPVAGRVALPGTRSMKNVV